MTWLVIISLMGGIVEDIEYIQLLKTQAECEQVLIELHKYNSDSIMVGCRPLESERMEV